MAGMKGRKKERRGKEERKKKEKEERNEDCRFCWVGGYHSGWENFFEDVKIFKAILGIVRGLFESCFFVLWA